MQRILIVEDEQPIRKLLEYNLKLSGYETISAADGETAIELVQGNQPPDLIVLDLMLPKLDGIEVCKRLRAQGSIRQLLC